MAKNDAESTTQSTQNAVQSASTNSATHHLIVIHPFGEYGKGACIEDANEIAAVLSGENAGACNRIAVAS